MITKHPAKHKNTVLNQICELIPPHVTAKLAKKHKVNSRGFTPWSHVVCLLYAQLTRAIGLNDICDSLQLHGGYLSRIRQAVAPKRNTLSNANRTRPAGMMEELFWETLAHLQSISPGFTRDGRSFKLPRGFRRTIHAIDSSTLQLVANCMEWGKHRRRKAAAKLHMTLNLNSFLPSFAVVDTAKDSDASRAAACCSHLQAGEIAVFDRAYVIFDLFNDLEERGVFWVTRAKEGMNLKCVKRLIRKPKGNVLRDDLVVCGNKDSKQKYPRRFRRVVALVEVRGEMREMTFLTNNLEWAPGSVCDLYRCRWEIEVFFREIKQTLQIADFYGHNKNAVQWQVWSALLAYVLLRYLKYLSKWPHAFRRLFTTVRATVWRQLDLILLLKPEPDLNGTAVGGQRMCGHPEQLYMPGFEPPTNGTAS